jgi:hypothetical protein
LCRNIVALRRGDYHGTRLRLEEERTELEREKSAEEMLAYFQEWVKIPEVRELVAEVLPDGSPANPKSTRLRQASARQEVQNSRSRGNKRKKEKVRAGRPTKTSSQRDVPTNREECDGRLRQLFGLQPAAGQSDTLLPDGHQPESETQGDGQSGAENGSRSRSVKHSQGSDGGAVALQQLDVALAENTKPVITEAEKTLHFMRTLFGEPPASYLEEIERRKAEELGIAGAPSGGAPSEKAKGRRQKEKVRESGAIRPNPIQSKSEPAGPSKTNEEALSGVAPVQKSEPAGPPNANEEVRMQNEETEVPSPPHPDLLPRGGEGTRAAAGGEPASGGTESKSQGGGQSIQPESENPPRRVQEIPRYSGIKMIQRSRPIESNAPVERTRDFRGDPL